MNLQRTTNIDYVKKMKEMTRKAERSTKYEIKNLLSDDRHFWVHLFLMAACEFGEVHCHPDSDHGNAV